MRGSDLPLALHLGPAPVCGLCTSVSQHAGGGAADLLGQRPPG